MDRYARSELRRTVDGGGSLPPADATRLLDELDRIQRAAALPPEFMIRVARSLDDVDRWEASHPLFMGRRSAAHPADALALASIELRRALDGHAWPVEGPVRPRARAAGTASAMDRAVTNALAAEVEGEVGDALRWSLDELDRRTAQLDEQRDERLLARAAAGGDQAAVERLRSLRVQELSAARVRASDRTWDRDGFGPADALGLPLPCLVVALSAHRRDSWRGWRFSEDRPWFALEHRVAPRPFTRYERAVVSPLNVGAEVELALRRMAPRMPEGRSVGAARAFHRLAAQELPGIDVDSVDDRLGPAWVPLPAAALATLCAGTADEGIDLGTLAESPGIFGVFAGWWTVAWVADATSDGGW